MILKILLATGIVSAILLLIVEIWRRIHNWRIDVQNEQITQDLNTSPHKINQRIGAKYG